MTRLQSVWPTRGFMLFLLLALSVWVIPPVAAQVAPEGASAAARLAFSHPDLFVANVQKPLRDMPAELGQAVRPQLVALGASEDAAFYDLRAGRWGTLVLSQPLLPGSGAGNELTWSGLGRETPAADSDIKDAAWSAFRAYLERFAGELRVDVREVEPAAVTVREGGRLVQINARRSVDGVPVRDSLVTAVINSGNLILYGTRNWGTVSVSTRPTVSKERAAAAVLAYVASVRGGRALGEPQRVIATLQNGDDPAQVPVGEGYRYRLAWAVRVSFKADHGSWEALVDARSGELLSFRDLNQYADRKVVGGVFPVSNDGLAPGGVPDGIEQSGWPMPFADIATPGAGPFTDSGGNLSCVTAPIQTQLSGRFVRIADNCGAISEAAAAGNLDLGTSGGTNCVVPSGHSAGDTHSARTGFFEVNRIKEMGRGWLPDNPWLQDQITANMNIDLECNAFWNGSSINFYRNLGGCRNTGEIAAVFDHEWGHGMDANDSAPGISTPGEAPADMYAMLRLNDSCIGRGFFLSGTCGGNGDPCTVCTGVREADWAKRQSGFPHDIAWIVRYPAPAPPGMPPGGCGAGTQVGPCGRETHCEGSMVTEVVWDLIHRDLAGPPFNMDANTALNAVARLHYLGGGNVNSWFQCDPTGSLGGCGADSGYMQYLAVDDDDGSLANGTPHMSAIYAAFDRHQMACRVSGPGSPPVPPVNSGCAGAPAVAPTVTVTAIDKGARVTWNAVPGAQTYWVFRTDGLHGCAFGKERVAIVTGTQLIDGGLMNGRPYVYTVEAVGAHDSCRSPASACASVVPAAGPNLRIAASSVQFQGLTGDGDPFLDNCEHGRVSFAVENSGAGSQTNVRIVGVEPVSHPDVEITSTFPIPVSGSLASCVATNASFTLRAAGLAFNDTVRFRVDLASDQSPVVRSQIVELQNAESDLEAKSSQTFSFNSTDLSDREGWEVVRGTYNKAPGGAEPTGFYLASSAAQNDACDQIRSPLVRLSATSALSLYNQFSTEPPTPAFGNVFYDRANIGIFDVAEGTRTPISPDGGRLYNASGPHGTCGTEGQVGWASEVAPGQTGAGWEQSTWSPTALQLSTFAGRMTRLDAAYGTDALVSGAGFWFDQVVLTNFELQVPDQQPDDCQPPACDVIDDSDHAVDYRNGWHRKTDPGASSGRYHVRVGAQGGGNTSTPTARVSFEGDQITYFFAKSDQGGTADIYVGGVLVETLSYHSTDPSPTFGHQRTYFTSGSGPHELRIEHRSGSIYVDGFGFACDGGSPDPAAAEFHSETEVSNASAAEGPIITRTVTVGPNDRQISVLVEGSLVPLTVQLVNPSGSVIATGQALVSGLTASGLDKAVSTTGVYEVQVINAPGAFTTISISNARMVENP
jgi:hypothetical protein